ncbi:MAG: hypothetical protein CM1200mP22_13360 [Dehalococcoidia bacterium]|nr:MAG: hypothetical protein CM1200mP22_13360 [Dehalococcoidia bacterium]
MPSELLGDGLIQTGLAKEIVGEPKPLLFVEQIVEKSNVCICDW